MAGIQSLTILLMVSLVVFTGVIIGSLSITTGNKATKDAEDTGDRGIAECFDSGRTDVVSMTNVVLDSTLKDISNRCSTLVNSQVRLLTALSKFMRARDPDITLTDEFMRSILVPYMQSVVEAAKDDGVIYIMSVPYGFSNNSATISKKPFDFGASVSVIIVDETKGIVGPDETHSMIWHTQGPMFPIPDMVTHPMVAYTSLDDSGNILQHGECLRRLPNFTAGEKKGNCYIPRLALATVSLTALANVSILNARYTSGTLLPKGEISYVNLQSAGNHLSILAIASFSHPSMPNRYPRQDHRVGMLGTGQNAQIFTDVLRSVDLPSDSHMYILEADVNTGKVEGTIIAASYGPTLIETQLFVQGRGYVRNSLPLPVSKHNDSEGRPSVIREHGVYMLSPESIGYEESTKLPVDVPHPWTSSNGTQYWSQVKKITAGSNLVWYITLLVSRDVVMKTIDEATDTIRINIDSDRSKADDDKKQSFTIMLVAVLVSAILLLGVGVMFTKVIISPLLVLQRDMECVAQMKLDNVDGDRPVSSLSEVRAMELSFRQMIKNLIEYRNYMPQSVLIDADETGVEDASEDGETRPSAESKKSSGASTSMASSKAGVAAQNQMLTDTTLKKKNISVVTFNVIEFHKLIHGKSDGKVHELHQQVLTTITTKVASLKGVCDTFSGDQVLATFNAVRPASGYALASAQAGKGAAQELKEVVQLSFACGSGDGKVGNMGIKGMKKFSILSTSVPFVVELEKLNRKYGLSGLIDHYQNGPVSVGTTLTKVFSITCPKRDAKPITAFEIVGLREVAEEEWMYQLENAAESNKSPWNETFEAIMTGDWDAAGKSFENCDKQHPLYSLMKEGVTTSKKDPLCYSM
eukprot:TRINITY_DN1137_c0_g1_i11.p1 TRINITY_DN1137_c0_g1~~TRINITY_DN1137_c0_g1_i11.p1  ORF type:complete len:883 (+),score=162.87 TRINITY_DN1137_c0_g1_i11:52-2649(+)